MASRTDFPGTMSHSGATQANAEKIKRVWCVSVPQTSVACVSYSFVFFTNRYVVCVCLFELFSLFGRVSACAADLIHLTVVCYVLFINTVFCGLWMYAVNCQIGVSIQVILSWSELNIWMCVCFSTLTHTKKSVNKKRWQANIVSFRVENWVDHARYVWAILGWGFGILCWCYQTCQVINSLLWWFSIIAFLNLNTIHLMWKAEWLEWVIIFSKVIRETPVPLSQLTVKRQDSSALLWLSLTFIGWGRAN